MSASRSTPAIRIEGLSPDAWLAIPHSEIDEFVLHGRAIAFDVGSSRVLGEFSIQGHTLHVSLAHIDGGGEGILIALTNLIKRFAMSRGLSAIHWTVCAAHCATPNLKLRRVLERRGFMISGEPGHEAYRKAEVLTRTPAESHENRPPRRQARTRDREG